LFSSQKLIVQLINYNDGEIATHKCDKTMHTWVVVREILSSGKKKIEALLNRTSGSDSEVSKPT